MKKNKVIIDRYVFIATLDFNKNFRIKIILAFIYLFLNSSCYLCIKFNNLSK